MSDYIQNLFAERIGGSSFSIKGSLYKFEKIKQACREIERTHLDTPIIDLGLGKPDWMADSLVIDTFYSEAKKSKITVDDDNVILAFQKAAVQYMDKVYGVSGLDSEEEVCYCIGSKPAFMMMVEAFINPGDICLMTSPGFPMMATMTKWLGGEIYPLDLKPENSFLPDLDSIPEDICKRAKILYLNYPNNPTGAVAPPSFFKKVIEFAKENQIIVVQDAVYGALTFDGYKPFSFLSVDGAKDVGIEIHSLSKAFNMTGWSLGFVAGNASILKGFACVKHHNDFGQLKAMQYAGIKALEHPEITEKTNMKYSRRHNLLVNALSAVGFTVIKPKAGLYLYTKISKGVEGGETFKNAEHFAQWLIKEKQISVVPWDDVGHYVRISVTFIANTETEELSLVQEIQKRLSGVRFLW
jgi:LL-diaminopimelate aminotransferase